MLFKLKSIIFRFIILLGTVVALDVLAQSQSQQSDGIASTSLCGDSYLLALAPEQVSTLSWQSRSALSMANETQRELPQIWDDVERIVAEPASWTVYGPGEGLQVKTKPNQSVTLDWGEDFDSVFRNVEKLKPVIGKNVDERSDIWHQKIEGLEHRASQRVAAPKVLYLARSGGSAGPGTFVDAAIIVAGGDNVITTPGWVTPDPELLVALQPDLIITSFFEDGYESVQATAIRHKTVRRFIAERPHINVPGKLWPCAGPGLFEAAELIADGLDRLSMKAPGS